MTKNEIWIIKRNLQELIADLKNHIEFGDEFNNTNPHFSGIDKQAKELREHIIESCDYTLAKEVTSYSRDSLHQGAYLYNRSGSSKSALLLTSVTEELLYIEEWLKVNYYHVPVDEVGNYYMRDGYLWNIYTMEKYSLYSAELLMLFNDDENLIREYLTYCDEHKNNSHQQLWKYRSYGKKVFMERNYKTMLHEQLKLLKLTDKTYDSFKKH